MCRLKSRDKDESRHFNTILKGAFPNKAILNHMTSDRIILMQAISNYGNLKSHDFR